MLGCRNFVELPDFGFWIVTSSLVNPVVEFFTCAQDPAPHKKLQPTSMKAKIRPKQQTINPNNSPSYQPTPQKAVQIGKAINTENATNSEEVEREKKNSRIDKIFRRENYCSCAVKFGNSYFF